MAPVGSELTSMQLVDALLWRLSQESEEQVISGELDDLEHKLSNAVSVVRFFRNMASPVHRIPPEILGIIFQILQDLATPADYLPLLPPTQPHSLESVACVCRRWRETALTLPSLWSLIQSGRGQLPYTSLERSADAPLTIYLRGTASWPCDDSTDLVAENVKLMGELASHSDRIRGLHLIDIEASVTSSELLCTRAPLLESLTISVGSPHYLPSAPPAPSAPGLPTIFDGLTPSLRRLALHGFTSWSTNIFHDLTHLTLSNQNPAHPIPMSQFASFLVACPRLEELSLVRSTPSFDGSTHQPIALDHLRVLSLGSWVSAREVARFLSFLVLPLGIQLFIWGTIHESDDDLSTIFPLSSTLLSDITQLRITCNPDRHLGSWGSGWGNDDSLYSVFSTPSAFQIDGSFQPSQILLLLAPQMFPLGSVEELWLGCEYHPDPTTEEWREFFSAMPLLGTLVISRRPSQPIITALTLESNDDSDTTLLCPLLHTLRLCSDSSRSVLRLAIFAEERMRKNRPIRLLQVIAAGKKHGSRKNRSPELVSDLMYLERYIQRVECDQKEPETNWELLDSWPPPVFLWVPGENHQY